MKTYHKNNIGFKYKKNSICESIGFFCSFKTSFCGQGFLNSNVKKGFGFNSFTSYSIPGPYLKNIERRPR